MQPEGKPSSSIASSPMWFVDGHLDLAALGVCGRDLTLRDVDRAVGCVTLPALRRGGVRLAFATIFTECGGDPATNAVAYRRSDDVDEAEAAGRRQLELYERLEDQGLVRIVRTRRDLDDIEAEAASPEAPLPIVLLMECADPIRDADAAGWWVARGVRLVGLAWARGSRYAGGNAAPGPLTEAGRELVEALDELGVVHDLSHLSDDGADELLALARGPVIASHSNCRALTGPSQRHLPDRLLRAVADRGGVVGLNLFSQFLCAGRRAGVADCLAHVRHMASVMGHVRGVALGSDMDGGFAPDELPEGLDAPERLPALAEALRDAGWTAEEVAAFAHRNWMRFLRGALT